MDFASLGWIVKSPTGERTSKRPRLENGTSVAEIADSDTERADSAGTALGITPSLGDNAKSCAN